MFEEYTILQHGSVGIVYQGQTLVCIYYIRNMVDLHDLVVGTLVDGHQGSEDDGSL